MSGPEGKQSEKLDNKPKSAVEAQIPAEKAELLRAELRNTGQAEEKAVDKVGGEAEDKEELKDAQAEAEVGAAEITAMQYAALNQVKVEFSNELFSTLGGTKVGVGAYALAKPGEQNQAYGEAFVSVTKGPLSVGAGVGKQGGEANPQLMFYCTLNTEGKIAITYYGATGKDSYTHGLLVNAPVNENMNIASAAYISHDLGKESGEGPKMSNFLGTLGLTYKQLTAGAYISVDPDKLGVGGMIGGTF